MRIHVLWVGNIRAHGVPESILQMLSQPTNLERSIPAVLRGMPADIMGFCSYLESLIQYGHTEVELYFHCHARFAREYKTIFDQFAQNMIALYHRLNPEYTRRKPLYHVVSFEDNLFLLRERHEINRDVIDRLETYLRFVQDPRVTTIRNLVNFRDIFNYFVLYLYGGYAFDANTVMLPRVRLQPYQVAFLRHVPIPVIHRNPGGGIHFTTAQDIFPLTAICATALTDQLEPILLLDAPITRTPPAHNSRHPSAWNSETTTFEEVSLANPHHRLIGFFPATREYRIQERRRGYGDMSMLQTDLYYDIFGLRCMASSASSLYAGTFLLNQLIQITYMGYTRVIGAVATTLWAFRDESISAAILAPILPLLQMQFPPPINPPPNYILPLRHARTDDQLFLTIEDFVTAREGVFGRYFFNLPLYKIFYNSHYAVNPDPDSYTNEHLACLAHFARFVTG